MLCNGGNMGGVGNKKKSKGDVDGKYSALLTYLLVVLNQNQQALGS